MAPPDLLEPFGKYFTVEEANRTLPLVRRIVADVVRQYERVRDLERRLAEVLARDPKRRPGDPYSDELAHSQAELEAENRALAGYVQELSDLGVELKGPDGLCDFPSLLDGREVYLCWRLGEPEIAHWHELDAGFAGRQPLKKAAPAGGLPR